MANKFKVGQKVKFINPVDKKTEVGTVECIDLGSGLIQLGEWKDAGMRTKWEPQDRFEAVDPK